jgi:hypothetical protein
MLEFACLCRLAVPLEVDGERLHGAERPAHLLRDWGFEGELGFAGPTKRGLAPEEWRREVALTRTMSCASDEATSAALESFAVTDVISADPVNSRVFFSPLVREWRECEAAGGNLEFFF